MERFDEHFVSVDKQSLLRIMDQNNRDSQWPIHSKKLVIPYSIMDEQLYEGKDDTIVAHTSLMQLDPPPHFDLVIIDEAHHIRNGSMEKEKAFNYKCVRYFCEHSDAVVMLTATPIQNSDHDLYTLLNVLRPDMIVSPDTFTAMSAPNAAITACAHILRSQNEDWQTEALNALREINHCAWGQQVITQNPLYESVVHRLSGAELTREERVQLIHDVESLHSFDCMINRTRRRDIQDFCVRRSYTISTTMTVAQNALYNIKIFNTINFRKSMHYNPFAYIHSEKDILKLVTTLIANTKGDGKAGDEFWTKAETLLYCALIGYIHYEAPVEEQNFSTLIEFLNAMEVREDDEEFQNPVDLMFEALEKKKPNHFAVRQYKKYKLAAGKTAKSILISCGARLAPFDIQEVRDITAYDELQLDTLGDKKTALFLIMSDTDATFNFLISMIYTQLFNLLCEKADDVYGGRLPVHVRCLIDEAANIGQIPNLEKLVATIRSREISACLVLQAQSQLKAIYKDNSDTIIGNMDSRIFLGGSEPTTLKELNQALGKETIDTYNTSNTRGNSPSYGMNYQKLGKDLATVDELAVLDGGKCILQLRGVRPFLSDKYDLTQHPNYKYTSDYDKKNEFNIEQFLSRRLKLKAGDEFVVVDAD